MISVLSLLCVVCGLLLLVPTLTLLVEIVLGAMTSRAGLLAPGTVSVRAAVLIPAHNESSGIARSVKALVPQLEQGDKVLVVADNCSDQTASIARSCGAVVAERFDTVLRGKGYALDFGRSVLAQDAPDVVIVVDADCIPRPGTIRLLKTSTAHSQRPVQGHTETTAPAGHERRFAVAAFAWRVKTLLRPLGLARLGLPTQLMGTGMAFPWKIFVQAKLASSNVVEDLELGLHLAKQGAAPMLLSDAVFQTEFPASEEGEITQRRRWESGSFSMLVNEGFKTLFAGLFNRNLSVVGLALDMMIPPLVLHGVFICGFGLLALLFAIVTGVTGPLLLALVITAMFAAAMMVAWWAKGRDLLPLKMWLQLIPFVLAKFRIYAPRNKAKEWVRTDRNE